jgi:hypothetical protein
LSTQTPDYGRDSGAARSRDVHHSTAAARHRPRNCPRRSRVPSLEQADCAGTGAEASRTGPSGEFKTNPVLWLFLVFFGWSFDLFLFRNQQVVGSNPTGGSTMTLLSLVRRQPQNLRGNAGVTFLGSTDEPRIAVPPMNPMSLCGLMRLRFYSGMCRADVRIQTETRRPGATFATHGQ